jgi:site-specific DNA recombinase
MEGTTYCLYARKSSEDDERQALSIDSQVKEMVAIAERENLNIAEIRRESHSAKASGGRPVFNKLLQDINDGMFSGIIAWAPDRLSRNAGDLGSVVDLMDSGKLQEIRTHSQTFTNSPNEKFLLMILCSQAKLENDNRGINVKRGLKNKAEMGIRPGVAPLGYLNERSLDRNKGKIVIDPERAPIIKRMFQYVADHGASGRTLLKWLNTEVRFTTRSGKRLTLSGVYRILNNHFYYGRFEYGGIWYDGNHETLITKELFDEVQLQLETSPKSRPGTKEFDFTKMIICGNCGYVITAEEKFKRLANGTIRKYVYYHCSRFDYTCKQPYMQEDELLAQLLSLIDEIDLSRVGVKRRLEAEVERLQKFSVGILGQSQELVLPKVDARTYAKYVLQEAGRDEKRELLGCLKSKLYLKDEKLTLNESVTKRVGN